MTSCSNRHVGRWWKHFVIVLTPLVLLLPLLLIPDDKIPVKANQCLYVMLWMAVYWCTEVLSLSVTACIPIFIFPMLSILTTEEVCSQYFKDTIMMFVGGLMVALAVEKCNLHRRIAVSVLHVVGTKPLWLMFGFMLPTWFLSMWISNTATTAMMIPISEAVLDSLIRSKRKNNPDETVEIKEISVDLDLSSDGVTNLAYDDKLEEGDFGEDDKKSHQIQKNLTNSDSANRNSSKRIWRKRTYNVSDQMKTTNQKDKEYTAQVVKGKRTGDVNLDKFAKGMTLAIAYAANTGGTATLIGTGPNPVMKDQADSIWQSHGYKESPVTFASWLMMGFPVATIILICVWIWLVLFFNGIRGLCPCRGETSEESTAIKQVIDEEYQNLGKITFSQVVVAIMFVAMVMLWFFRSPTFITGWADVSVFTPGYIEDAVVSIFIAFVLCIIPSKLPRCKEDEIHHVDTLLDWNTIQKKLPWSIIFLMGGGFSLAKASEKSGLSEWIAEGLAVMSNWPGWVMVFVICLITAFLTEITSNVATCTILMPIVSSLAEGVGHSPLYLMFPVALSTSFAFMLPVATPPNAIAFSFGRLRIIDMVKAGFILNFLCVAVVTLATHTWGDAFFDFHSIPWETVNTTTIPQPISVTTVI